MRHVFPGGEVKTQVREKSKPDFAWIHQELKRKGVTRQLLWEECRERCPETGYGYTQYCQLYRTWRQKQKRSMRQIHKAGDKLFIDYSGATIPVVNAQTGEIKEAELFVAALGASKYTYAEATWSQTLPDWIESHVRAFEFFQGVPALLVPDNLKSGVKNPCRYDPDVNPSYLQLARYYSTAILPARPRKPKDKAVAESGVQVAQRWIVARLRHETFFCLAQLNEAIRRLLQELNERPFKKLPGSRRSAFEALDKPELKPLPQQRYEYVHVKKARVHVDDHVEYESHYYSVPHKLVGSEVFIHATQRLVTVLHRNRQVACHVRDARRFITEPSHMPEHHREHHGWTPQKFLDWAHAIGPNTRHITQALLEHRDHPEQGYRACLGLLNLSRRYSKSRLEQACTRAHAIGSRRLKSVQEILKKGLDQVPVDSKPAYESITHENVRGAAYYDQGGHRS